MVKVEFFFTPCFSKGTEFLDPESVKWSESSTLSMIKGFKDRDLSTQAP